MGSWDPYVDTTQVVISASGVLEGPGTSLKVANILLNKAPRTVLSLINHEKYNNGKTTRETLVYLAIEIADLLPYVEIGLKGGTTFKIIGKGTRDLFKSAKYWNEFIDVAHMVSEFDNVIGALGIFGNKSLGSLAGSPIEKSLDGIPQFPNKSALSTIPEFRGPVSQLLSKWLESRNTTKRRVQYFSDNVARIIEEELRKSKNETNTKSNIQKQRIHDRKAVHRW